jgi:hypothetical protein
MIQELLAWNIVLTESHIKNVYACAAGMLLHINGKFTERKLKSSLLSLSFILIGHSCQFLIITFLIDKTWNTN